MSKLAEIKKALESDSSIKVADSKFADGMRTLLVSGSSEGVNYSVNIVVAPAEGEVYNADDMNKFLDGLAETLAKSIGSSPHADSGRAHVQDDEYLRFGYLRYIDDNVGTSTTKIKMTDQILFDLIMENNPDYFKTREEQLKAEINVILVPDQRYLKYYENGMAHNRFVQLYNFQKIQGGYEVELFPGTTARIHYDDLLRVTVETDAPTGPMIVGANRTKLITFEKDSDGRWNPPLNVRVPGEAEEPRVFDQLVEMAHTDIQEAK